MVRDFHKRKEDVMKRMINQANISEVEEKEEVLALMVYTQEQKAIKSEEGSSSTTEGSYSSESSCDIMLVTHKTRAYQYPVDESWYLDSAATTHMTFNRDAFFTYEPLRGREVIVGDKGAINAIGIGSVCLSVGHRRIAIVREVFHVP